MASNSTNILNQSENINNNTSENPTESMQPTSFQTHGPPEPNTEAIKKRKTSSISVKNAYPVAVAFVLGSKFFESFAANGIRTVLALFLRDYLHYDEDFATTVLHIFNFISQFVPIFGALIADSYLGNSRTIFYIFFIYAIGYATLCITTIPFWHINIRLATFLALAFIASGNGGIRACVTSLGAEQFTLPQQQKALNKYFSQYYFFYTCVIFLIGYKFYKSEIPKEKPILLEVLRYLLLALWDKIKWNKKTVDSKKDWLDHTSSFENNFIEGVKILLRLLLLFLPIPVYFALTAQQDSTWTFQATQLDTNLFGIFIQPDQVKVLGPFLLLINILLFNKLFYPILKKIGLELRPLQKIGTGAAMAAIAFLCVGVLQTSIEKNEERYFEFVDIIDYTNQSRKLCFYNLSSESKLIFDKTYNSKVKCSSNFLQESQLFGLNNSTNRERELILIKTHCDDNLKKIISVEINEKIFLSKNETGEFNLYLLNGRLICYINTINLNNSHTLVFSKLYENEEKISLYKIPFKKISVIWQVPQFFLLMLGELFLAIPGLQFAFTQAPDDMKSVLVAFWFINNALGNLIVICISEMHITQQSIEFYLYAVIMLLSTIIFIFLSRNYEYVEKFSTPEQNYSSH